MTAHLVLNANAGNYSALYQANRFAVRSADGTWFFGVQDGTLGRVLHLTSAGMVDIPLNPQPTMRPTLYADHSGLYCIGGFDGDKKQIPIWYIDDYHSVFQNGGNDPRVDALISQTAAMNQQIAALETALANISQEHSDLDPKDRTVLNRLRVFFGLD